MTSFSVPAGVVVLTGFGGAPRDPQPASITIEDAGNGVVGRWPDGTEKNINAPDEAPAPKPRMLTPNQVVDLMLAVLGASGFAACVRSDLDAMVTWRYKLNIARDIAKDQAAQGLSIIVAAGLMTADQRTAILSSWPTI